jgi:hypothetical protein
MSPFRVSGGTILVHRVVTAGHSILARAFQCPGRGTGFFSSSVCLIRVAPGVAAVLAAGLFLAGCGDADLTDPVEISSEETVASLQFNGQLPVLPALVDRWKGGNALADLSREWRTSWELPLERPRRDVKRFVRPFPTSWLTERMVSPSPGSLRIWIGFSTGWTICWEGISPPTWHRLLDRLGRNETWPTRRWAREMSRALSSMS